MLKLYAYTCLLSALSVVEMNPLNINGHVGGNVTFKCSDWNVWTDETFNVKYFCNDPCSEDDHIIVKAAFGQTAHQNKIKITNKAEGLFVTFTNLQKSDSKTYFCGLERSGFDSYIKVKLKVTDDKSFSPKTSPGTVVSSPSMSSSSSDIITDMSMSYTTLYSTTPSASAPQGAGYVPYLISGLIFIITVAIGLILTRKMMKKRQMAVSTPQEDTRESAGRDEVNQSHHTLTTDKDQVYSMLTPTKMSAGPDEVYQSLHTLMMDKDQVYSTLTPMKRV